MPRFTPRLPFAATTLALAAGAAVPLGAVAQDNAGDYPDQTVHLFVPYPAGGAMDFVGRLFARTMADLTGEPVVVENRPGAGTAIAANALADAEPDGYTLMLAPNATLTITSQLYETAPFDPSRLDPLAVVGTNQMVLSASGQSGITDLDELLEEARANPESVSYGSFGNGNITHLLGALLSDAAGAPMLHVPFQGAAPAMNALLGGNITATFDTITNAEPQIKAGKIAGLAVTGTERSPLLPEVPTFEELGYPELASYTWVGMVAPLGLEPALKQRIQSWIGDVLANEDFREQMNARGFDVPAMDADGLADMVAAERETYRGVIESAGIRLD